MRKLAVIVAGALLAGCAGGPVLSNKTIVNPEAGSLVQDDLADGAITLERHGNPFDVPGAVLDTGIATAAEGLTVPGLPPLELEPGQGEQGLRLVAVFNPLTSASSSRACSHPGSLVGEPVSQVATALFAYCSGPFVETTVRGRVTGVSHPDDPRFRAMVRRSMHAMFNVRPEQIEDDWPD